MVTRVQVGSVTPLPGVPGLSELAKEETLHRAYFRQAVDPPGAPSARLLDRKSPLRSPTRILPLSRLAPKPFSKDQAPDMKSPDTSWGLARPGFPCGHPQDGVARELGEKMPNSVGQEVGVGTGLKRSTSLFYKAEFLQISPSTNRVLENTEVDPTLGKGVLASGTPKVNNTRSTQEPLPGPLPEVAAKPAVPARKPVGTVTRPAFLPLDTRLAVTSDKTSPKELQTQASGVEDLVAPALEPRPRPKRRPVSAIYMESIQPQRVILEGASPVGKMPPTPPEKTWVRRPRPLSMDLTARFESREVLLKKGAEEALAGGIPQRQGPERAKPEPKVDGEHSVPATDTPEVAPKHPERREKSVLKQLEMGSLRTVGGSAKADNLLQDQTVGDQKVQLDREPEPTPQVSSSRPGKGQDPAEVKNRAADGETGTPRESGSRLGLWKHISSVEGESSPVLVAASKPPPISPEPPSEAPALGRAGVSVLDRIKGWAGENSEPRPERRRKTVQARPLSMDLTKLFSSPAASHEVRYEKLSARSSTIPQEPQDKQKEGPVLDAVTSPKSPWKPGALREKAWPPERKDSTSHVPDRCQEGSATITPEADGSFQTVRATLFEHHVERHTVTTTMVADGSRRKPRPERGSWLGKDPPGDSSKPEAGRWLQCPDTEKSVRSTRSNGEPKPQHSPVPDKSPLVNNDQSPVSPFLRHLEPLPMVQKVQPHLSVVPAVGGRVDSQTVPMAPEETAVTLRSSGSRHRLKVGQRPPETLPGYPEDQGLGHRTSLIWEVPETSAASGPKTDLQEPKGNCLSPRWTKVARWHPVDTVQSVESGQERSPKVVRPCATEATLSRATQTTIISEVPREGRQGAANKQDSCFPGGERGPSWGRPTDTCSDLWAQPGADLAALVQKAKGSSNGAARGGETQQAQAPEPLVRLRRAPGDQRLDRWRRRTLPNDVRFEEFSFLAPEQRQSDYLGPSTTALRDPTPAHRRVEGQEKRPGGSRDPALATGKPVSQEEPRATFFALTCQLPEAQKPKNSKPETPPFMERSRKMAPPPSPQLASPSVSVGQEEPSEPRDSKNCARGRERDGISFSKPQKPANMYLPSGGDRFLDPSGEKKDAGAFCAQQISEDRSSFQNEWRNSRSKSAPDSVPQTTPAFKSPKASDLILRQTVSERHPGRTKDGYRSSVLDIDALMEEYRKQPAWGSTEAQESPSVQANHSSPEKQGKQGRMDGARRSPKEGRETEGSWKRNSFFENNHGSTRASSPGTALNPKINALLWTVLPSAPCEKDSGASTGSEGPRNNASGPPENEKGAFAGRHHPSRSPSYPVEPRPAAWVELGRRCTRNGEEGSGGPPRAGSSHHRLTPPDVKRTCSEKGPPAHIREGLSVLQDAWERRREQPKGRSSLPTETLDVREINRGLGQQDLGSRERQKVRPLGNHEQLPRKVSPASASPRRSHSFCRDKKSGPFVTLSMDYLGDKLTVAQSHMSQWVGTVRRSFQEALTLVSSTVGHERPGGDEPASRTPFKRTSSFRHLASRGRESFRRFSTRSQQRFSSLRKRQTDSEPPDLDQLKQCFSRRTPEAKDTDTLVQEAESQYGTWTDQRRRSGESLAPESPSPDGSAASPRKQPPSSQLSSPSSQTEPSSTADSTREPRSASVDRSSTELDSADGTEVPPPLDSDTTKTVDDFAGIDQTSVLDSSALKTRVQLSKRSRRQRTPISHAHRRSRLSEADTMTPWEEEVDSAWMFRDSTEEKSPRREESDDEEKPEEKEKSSQADRTPGGHTQRMRPFPAVDPAVLKAQLHKRPEADSSGDSPSWTPQPKTPKSPFQPGVLGSRVLPSSVEKDERSEVASPQWLKDLKTKKRQSLYENQA